MTLPKGCPIAPDEINTARRNFIPPEVFDAFNELIVEEWKGHDAVLRQYTVIKKIQDHLHREDEAQKREPIPFKITFLEIDDLYRQAGWTVVYDSPAYNESYEPTWTFSKKKQRLND